MIRRNYLGQRFPGKKAGVFCQISPVLSIWQKMAESMVQQPRRDKSTVFDQPLPALIFEFFCFIF